VCVVQSGTEELSCSSKDDLCVFCGEGCDEVTGIRCEEYDLLYHLVFLEVNQSQNSSAFSFVNLLGWTCRWCRFDRQTLLKTLKAELLALKEVLKELCNKKTKRSESRPLLVGSVSDECLGSSEVGVGASMAGLTGRKDNVQAQLQVKKLPDQNNIESLIEKTVKTINRKRLNVVVSGFHDSGSEENDKAALTNLCGDYLR